ncbi:c-type cytochrome [Simplicispira psychrophila]|uniref:c-type cytochrome n=1 Tax=Simplicispira psychrophila TaxID=80882 RepID=UPI000483F44B|nr:c-type cytochrome [Simplicispira psychrophila]
MNANHSEETHTGPIKNPKQLLSAVLLAFLIPIFAIIALVSYVTSGNKPGSGAANPAKAVAERIQKIGIIEIREANRGLQSGEDVFKAQCSACHATGAVGAPKFGDADAWGPRIKTGFNALLHSAIAGKGAMAPQGGGAFNEIEIGRAVVYMANAAGAKFTAPAAPADTNNAAAATPATSAEPAAQPIAAVAPAAASAATEVAAAAPAAGGAGEALYKQACQVCHAAGVAGAPKFGDKAAWAPRMKEGMDAMYAIATNGKGAMPPRGGTTASDADLRAAVDYMAAAAK